MFQTNRLFIDLSGSVHARLCGYARKAENARLRRFLRPDCSASRLSKILDAFWAHLMIRRAIASLIAILAAPAL